MIVIYQKGIEWGLVLGGRKGYENWDNPKNLTFLDRTRPPIIFIH
jgi:hypothetical protein